MMRGATNNKKLCNDLLLTAAQILQAGEIICGSELGDSEPQGGFQEGHARTLMRLRLSVMNESGLV